ncbi:CidA/LrgA family protein [Snodgrassella alvi]|uniref:CidA/LrgA family protein n=1 Tax=Snodgrassella alvi TaxID=1196083 RepID=UPI003516D4E1
MNILHLCLANCLRICIQIGVIILFWVAGLGIEKVTHIPLSAGVIGLFLLLVLLQLKIIKLSWVSSGAQALLGELMLYFMPILIAVVQYKALFMAEGWQLIVSIVSGTFLVMSSTALTLKYCYRLRRAWIKRRHI